MIKVAELNVPSPDPVVYLVVVERNKGGEKEFNHQREKPNFDQDVHRIGWFFVVLGHEPRSTK